jgi:enamine deaminase RidA (YjgF/YER057c/UK114 family)
MYLVDAADVKPVDLLYAQMFPRPYPSRATVIVSALTVPGMRIELSAIAASGGVR